MKKNNNKEPLPLYDRARALGLWGVLSNWNALSNSQWLTELITMEEEERSKRQLVRRTSVANLGTFRPLADFDWSWPTAIDRARIEELFSLEFIPKARNIPIIGPNGTGKTMIARNIAHHAVMQGYTVLTFPPFS
jgi:DNA replication protein DnaC